VNPRDEEENVVTTLLEFGEYHVASSTPSTKKTHQSEIAKQLEDQLGNSKSTADEEKDELRRRQLAQQMTQLSEGDPSNVKNFLSLDLLAQVIFKYNVHKPIS
jgi:hypothetical protein